MLPRRCLETAHSNRLGSAALDRRNAGAPARPLAGTCRLGTSRLMQNGVDEARDRASKQERIRLLEAQAESLRREIHFLHRWREQRTYTASWHIFRALFAIEVWLNRKVRSWTGASGGPAPLIERRRGTTPLPDLALVAGAQSAAKPVPISETHPARL